MDDNKVHGLVLQWLAERGYTLALAALKEESRSIAEMPETGGQLCSLLYEHAELKLSLEVGSESVFEEMRRAAEEEIRDLPEELEVPQYDDQTLSTLHAGNIIACKFNADSTLFASGSSDRSIKIVDMSTRKALPSSIAHAAPVLAVTFCPSKPTILLSTAMDGSVMISNAQTGETLQEFKDHSKYATRAAWSPDGQYFATCGHDKNVNVYKRASAEEEPLVFELAKKKEFPTIPEALCFLDDGMTLVASIREDNYLSHIDVTTFEITKVNMNPVGDDHVSFTVLDMALSPNGKYLLCSTDKSRLLLYVVGTSIQLRYYYGAVNDDFCQTRACWHPSGAYIYVTSQDQKVYCWHVHTQKVVAQMRGHQAVVRDCDVSPDGKFLISASFDKTVKIWKC